MAEVYVTKEAQQYSENIISQYLRDAGYDGSLEDGTSLYDVVVRPAGLIYTLFRQDIDKAYAYMSLAKANELRSTLSEEDYDAAIDGILSNWFVARNDGQRATGYVRMWFSVPPSFISFTEGQVVGTYGSVTLLARIRDIYSADAKAFIPDDFKSRMNTSNNQTEYYIDLPVIASEPADVSILEGAVINVAYTDINFLRGTAAADFTPGTALESSDDFVERTQEAITTRELITRRAFNTVLPDMFPELSKMYVAGCGDYEMIRDFVTFQNVTVHVGNMADIWVASRLVLTSEECAVQEDDGGTYIELSNSPASVLSIRDTAPDYLVPGSGKYIDITSDAHVELWEDGDKTFENQWLIPQDRKTKVYVTLPALSEDEETAWHDAVDTDEYEEYEEYGDMEQDAPASFSSPEPDGVALNMEPNYGTFTLTEDSPGTWSYEYAFDSETYAQTGIAEDSAVVSVVRSDGLTEYYSLLMSIDYENSYAVSYWLSSKRVSGEPVSARVLEVSEITSNVATAIQDFIANDTNRVASFDPQVKMMVPVAMSFNMTVTTAVNYTNINSSNYDQAATESLIAKIKSSVIEYLEDVKQSGGVYIESEMVKRIHNEVPEVAVVHLPVETTAMLFDMKSGHFLESEVQNRFSLSGFGDISRQITTNTLQYYTNENLINIELQ